jgi:CDP-diacylglycerol--glycerol-3-phosphate 3-phosphatidyltransferase
MANSTNPTSTNETVWSVPNLLTLSRIPLTALLCYFIAEKLWLAGLITFIIAALTDAIDGWWARKFNQLSAFGRTFDPLTDKVLIGCAFIFLIQVPETGMEAWMVAVVIARELLVTGIRGYVESLGKKFGADWFGKLKTILQCACLITALTLMTVLTQFSDSSVVQPLKTLHFGVLYAMLAATVLSGVQYVFKAIAILR